jgi:hypothetical protein
MGSRTLNHLHPPKQNTAPTASKDKAATVVPIAKHVPPLSSAHLQFYIVNLAAIFPLPIKFLCCPGIILWRQHNLFIGELLK